MKLNFRQGLISYQASGSMPQFLEPGTSSGYLDLAVDPMPFIATIAHGASDYLLKFDAVVPNAFGPLIPGVENFLYLEMNVITGAVTFGITTTEPIVSPTAPLNPVPAQMWFDSTAKVMKSRAGGNTKWIDTPRLIIGTVQNGNPNQIIHKVRGSTVGLNEPSSPGFILLDSQLRPLRTSAGELLTSDSPVRVKTTVGTSGVLTSPVNNFIPARANEPIPAMSLVYFSGSDSISLASSNPALIVPRAPIGLVELPLAQNEVGVLTQSGEIVFDQWNWGVNDFGKPLYCGYNGEITLVRPPNVQVYRVGYVKSTKTILFFVDSETQQQVLSTAGSIISGIPPIVSTTSLNLANEVVTTLSIPPASTTANGYMTSAQAAALLSFDTRITTNTNDITLLQTTKAATLHQHTIANVTDLQTTLNTLETSIIGKADKVSGAIAGNFAALDGGGNLVDSALNGSSFALVSHQHPISEVINLQSALNAKIDIGTQFPILQITDLQTELQDRAYVNHTHSIANVNLLQAALDAKSNVGHDHNTVYSVLTHNHNGVYSPVGHGHAIADTAGLQSALDGKAPTVHGHAIADTTGLQAALDGKAPTIHGHAMSDVSGLVTALGNKSEVTHVHSISGVTGLQTALDDKSPVGHGHAIADTTGLQTALDGKAPTVHTHVIADTTGLQDALDNHTHIIADTTGLQSALDGKAPTVHGHVAADITGGTAGYVLTSSGAGSATWETAGLAQLLIPSTTAVIA